MTTDVRAKSLWSFNPETELFLWHQRFYGALKYEKAPHSYSDLCDLCEDGCQPVSTDFQTRGGCQPVEGSQWYGGMAMSCGFLHTDQGCRPTNLPSSFFTSYLFSTLIFHVSVFLAWIYRTLFLPHEFS